MQAQFEQLYKHYYIYVLRYIQKRVHRCEDAEDMVQETFTRAWSAFASACDRDEAGQRAWLFAIASHLVVDTFRRQSRAQLMDISLFERELYAPERFETVVDRDEIRRLLSCLKPLRREVFYLKEQGYTNDEIATMRDASYESIKMNLIRDKRKLARLAAVS
jgi:RNA polymerase sigma factor (sigma-70 family)